MKLLRNILSLSLAVGLAVGCAAEDESANPPSGPRILGLSKSKLVVGEPLSVIGHGFFNPADGDGYTKLVFDGVFLAENTDGTTAPPEVVSGFTIRPLYDAVYLEDAVEQDGVLQGRTVSAGTTLLRWSRFGPFAVPFGPGNKPGTFNGTVRPVNFYDDGSVAEEGEAAEVVIQVEPSIIIKRLEPITGYENGAVVTPRCEQPALRGHGGMPYILEVEAVGFEPAFFKYEFNGVQGGPLVIDHKASGRTDRVGDATTNPNDPPIVFENLDDDEGALIATVRVTGVDANNNAYETGLPLRIVRPMAFHYDGRREVAEYYEPVLVNGPITGSIGTTVTYSESETETRQRGVSFTVSKSFTQSQNNVQSESWSEGIAEGTSFSSSSATGTSHSESASSSESYGQQVSSSESASVGFSSSEGDTWGWNTVQGKSQEEYESEMQEVFGQASASVETKVGAEGSVPGFAKVSGSVGTTVGATVGASNGGQTGKRESVNESTGSSMGGNSSETESFGSTTTDGKSQSFTGNYAVASQATVNTNTSETEAKSSSKTFSMGGSGSISEGVSEGNAESWSETFVNTSSKTTSLSNKASVPSGACAKVYRQTTRWARVAQVYSYDLCGVRTLVGETVFTEWSWASEIPVAATCDEAEPRFPKAECFIACD